MEIMALTCLRDNYIWMLCDHKQKLAWAVDPGESRPVVAFLEKFSLNLCGILITHHHHDHTGGVEELAKIYKNIIIAGSHRSPVRQINEPLQDAGQLQCLDATCRVMEIPGHTLDHLAFLIEKAVFCGDTLFSMGCGKIFEGTAAQMYHSLMRLSQLPEDSEIYCGHEYTLQNLKFAQMVDPDNPNLQKKFHQVMHLSEQRQPSLPSHLIEEKTLNPFLRCEEPKIVQAVEFHCQKKLTDPIEVFYQLRQWKNSI
jgi:hydroxyacylglutathione hydrolase